MSSSQISPPEQPPMEHFAPSAGQPTIKKATSSTIAKLCKDASGYIAAVLLTLTTLTVVLQLWDADLTVPLRYAGGDGTLYLMLVHSTLENGWYLDNDRLGAVGGQNLRDYPMPEALHFGVIKLLGYLVQNPTVTANLYYLLPYPLTALTAYWTLRRFRLDRLPAVVASVLYACAPYHFCRMIGHPILAAYYLLPLSTWVIVRLFLGRRSYSRNNVDADKDRRWLGNCESAAAVAVCALTGVAGVYYAFFTCFFLAAAGVNAALRDRQWRPIAAAATYILLIIGAVGANLAPNLLYMARYGRNQEAAWRSPAEADVFGLNVSEMLLPIEGHRLPLLAKRREKYLDDRPKQEGSSYSPLGFVASAGFLLLIARFLWGRRHKGDGIEDALAYLTVAAVGLASIGGLGASFNFYVTPMMRCYNRISIYIAFFALAGLFLMLERQADRWVNSRNASVLYALGLGALLLLGIFDQTSTRYIPDYSEAKRQYNSDAEFGRRMEAALPPNSLVYGLPYVRFPEAGVVQNMPDYELLRPYLHTRTLRWSYGAVVGRPEPRHQAAFAKRPLTESLPELLAAGFRGIYLDRAGFADNGAGVEAELVRLLDAEPQVSQTGRQVFFDLTGYAHAHPPAASLLP